MTTINPDHYRNVIPNIEVIQVTENFNFNRGNAIKYLARAGAKDKATEVEDLKKAAWYCVREVKRLGGHLIAADLGLEG